MIFDKITIHNLFSYYGSHVFELQGATAEKNIVLISGRNGYGKTSFLKCLILLFGGVHRPEARTISESGDITLRHREFLIGKSPIWTGVLNATARLEGAQKYYVEAEWMEGDDLVRMRRKWNPQTLDEVLTVFCADRELDEEEKELFLQHRLPVDLISYFFFDGEQIKKIAENSYQVGFKEHALRLLGVQKIVNLSSQCDAVLQKLGRSSVDEGVLTSLENCEKKVVSFSRKVEDLQIKKGEGLRKIDALKRRKRRVSDELEQISISGQLSSDKSFDEQIERIEDELYSRREAFIKQACLDLPMASNKLLMQQVKGAIEKLVNQDGLEARTLLEKLSRSLPEKVFGLPPYSSPKLGARQEAFYKEKLSDSLLTLAKEFSGDATYSIALDRLYDLKERFSLLLGAAEQNFSLSTSRLDSVLNLKIKLNKVHEEKLEASQVSERVKDRYYSLKNNEKSIDRDLSVANTQLGKWEAEIATLERQLLDAEEQLDKIKENFDELAKQDEKVTKLSSAMRVVEVYMDELKDAYRETLESAFSDRLKLLFDSSTLIDSISLNKEYVPVVNRQDGVAVHAYSTSSGTLQLIATALLWALKDVSGKDLPIVIDTPLARIDKRHQENLLTRFYPNVSQQVIILPTDSELDAGKHALVKQNVYREFLLENDSGVSTSVRKISAGDI